MIKNSIELAQVLSTICTEPYTALYYKMTETVYNCLKAQNFFFIYVSPQRHGLALDFQTKLRNAHKTPQNRLSIVIVENLTQLERQAHPEDVLLLLDENQEILDFANNSNIFTLSFNENSLKTNLSYTIPCVNPDRTSEIQQILLNSMSEDILKFLP
jgi:hypothetical protein